MLGSSFSALIKLKAYLELGLFGIVVAVAVYSVLRLEMHQDDVFFLFF
jgi:hypothetical protein